METDYRAKGRIRGGDRGNQYQSGNPTNVGIAPSAQEHANSIGVDVVLSTTTKNLPNSLL